MASVVWVRFPLYAPLGVVAELVDALDLGSSEEIRRGSIPLNPTIYACDGVNWLDTPVCKTGLICVLVRFQPHAPVCLADGIGRHAVFRRQWLRSCGFESRAKHHFGM